MSVDWIALSVGVATAAGVGYSIFQGQQTSKIEREKNVIELVEKLEEQLTIIKQREVEMDKDVANIVEKTPDCYRYASDYLNVLERLAFLGDINYANKNTMMYFNDEFSYGLKLIQWKKQMGYIKNDKPYFKLQKHVKEHGITMKDDDSSLPKWLGALLENQTQIK